MRDITKMFSEIHDLQNRFISPIQMQQQMINKFGVSDPLKLTSIIETNAIQRGMRDLLSSTTLDSLKHINDVHRNLFSNIESFSRQMSPQHSFVRMNDLQLSLRDVASQIARLTAYNSRPEWMEQFKTVNDQAFTLSETIVKEEAATKKDIEDIKAYLKTIETTINTKDKSLEALIFKWMSIIAFILAIMSEVRQWNQEVQPNAITKQDLEVLKKEITVALETKFKEVSDYRVTKERSKIYRKPNNKASCLATLPIGVNLVVLNTKHKWIYVSYTNPHDGLSETGWILKKYTDKP